MNETVINEFLKKYDEGQRIFMAALYNTFGNEAKRVGEYLVENNRAKQECLLRCPICDFACSYEHSGSRKQGREFCVACDAEFDASEYIHEPVYIYKG
jgi:hypothetical protein